MGGAVEIYRAALTKSGEKEMNKLIAILAVVVGFSARAGLDTTGLNYIEVQAPVAFTNGTSYGPTNGVDVSNYKGNVKIIVYGSGNTTVNAATNTAIVLQHSTAQTGTWATVSSVSLTAPATTGSVVTASIDSGVLRKYVRLAVTLQGTNALNHYIGATIVAP